MLNTVTSTRSLSIILILVTCLGATMPTSAGIFDTIGEKKMKSAGKQNDSWYAANKGQIKFSFSSVNYNTNHEKIVLQGTIENLSKDRISSVIIDFIIVNAKNNIEALRERMMIPLTVFGSETVQLGSLEIDRNFAQPGESDIVKCLYRIKDATWSCQAVTAISKKVEDEAMLSGLGFEDYYKVRSIWKVSER
jgi:hypothetical protein